MQCGENIIQKNTQAKQTSRQKKDDPVKTCKIHDVIISHDESLLKPKLMMRRINHCLNPSLIELCQHVQLLEELNVKLKHYLPEALIPHCHVGSFNKGCLVIVADDAVWASQLRYGIPELRDKLRCEAGIYQLTSVKLVVATKESSHPTKASPKPLSKKAREAIITGSQLCQHAPLKEALFHLAQTSTGNKPDCITG